MSAVKNEVIFHFHCPHVNNSDRIAAALPVSLHFQLLTVRLRGVSLPGGMHPLITTPQTKSVPVCVCGPFPSLQSHPDELCNCSHKPQAHSALLLQLLETLIFTTFCCLAAPLMHCNKSDSERYVFICQLKECWFVPKSRGFSLELVHFLKLVGESAGWEGWSRSRSNFEILIRGLNVCLCWQNEEIFNLE